MDKGPSTLKRFRPLSHSSLWSGVAWCGMIVVIVAGLIFITYKARVSVYRVEYEGRIVDKWVGYTHSTQGSILYFRLLIETDNGQKITVAVDRENYERAKVGMRIKKTRSDIELSRLKEVDRHAFTSGREYALDFEHLDLRENV